jgi:large repetitive protein
MQHHMILRGLIGFILLPQISFLWAQNLMAFDDYFGLIISESKRIEVLSNDIYPAGAILSILSYTNNTKMSNPPRVVNGKEIEILSPQELGKDQINYKLCAGNNCVTATMHISVHLANNPHAIDDIFVITALNKETFYILKNDVGANASNLTLISSPRHGTASVQGDKIEYTPYNLSFEIDSMDYKICKGSPTICSSARIYVYNYNSIPPIIRDVTIETAEETDYQFVLLNFLHSFEDPLGKPMTGIKVISSPANGMLKFKRNIFSVDFNIEADQVDQLVYTPNPQYSGEDFFEWQAVAGGRKSNTAKVQIKVNPSLKELIVYEGFSPNGDSPNDQWIIDGIEDYPENRVKIFNRFGILVFETSNYDNISRVWSGETNVNHLNAERLAPNDVYYYLISVEGGKSRKGSVALKR